MAETKLIEFGLLHIGSFFIGMEFVALTLLVLIAAAWDIKARRVPNWLILIGISISFFYHIFSGYGYGFTFFGTGLLVGFIAFFPLYIIRAMGAGDVKLMAAIGSFLGGVATFQTIVLTFLAGGALAILVILWNRSWKLVFENIGSMTTNITLAAMTRQLPSVQAPTKSAGNLPYGVAIAAGTLFYIAFFRP